MAAAEGEAICLSNFFRKIWKGTGSGGPVAHARGAFRQSGGRSEIERRLRQRVDARRSGRMKGLEFPALRRPQNLLAHHPGVLCRSPLAVQPGGLYSRGVMAEIYTKAGAGAFVEAGKHLQQALLARLHP